MLERSLPWLATNLGLDRIGDEALVVRQTMELLKLGVRRRLFSRKSCFRAKSDDRHHELAFRISGHHTLCRIMVVVHYEAMLDRDGEKPKHVATGQGGDEGFLGIDGVDCRIGQRDDMRGRRASDFDTAVEAENVLSAEAIVDELLARPRPDYFSSVDGHSVVRSNVEVRGGRSAKRGRNLQAQLASRPSRPPCQPAFWHLHVIAV